MPADPGARSRSDASPPARGRLGHRAHLSPPPVPSPAVVEWTTDNDNGGAMAFLRRTRRAHRDVKDLLPGRTTAITSLHRASCLTRRWSIARAARGLAPGRAYRRIAQAAVLSRAQHAPIRTRMTTLHPGWMAAQGRSCGHREPSGRSRAGWERLQGKHPLVTGSSTSIGFVASDRPDMRPHGGYYVWLSLASGWTAAKTT